MHDAVQSFREAIVSTLGHAPEVIEPGRIHRFATSGRRGDSAGWCKLFDDLRGGVFGCYRQGISESWCTKDRATMSRAQRAELARQVMAATAEREAQQRHQWAENARRIAKIWKMSVPLVAGDPVTLYLTRRGIDGARRLPDLLRFHCALPYWHDGEKLGTFAAMVAPIVAPDSRMLALHRTYLTIDGRKAKVPTVKKVTGATGPLAGACIPLHRPLGDLVGVAEGIETALASTQASGVPTVAAYCAGAVANFQWAAGVRRVVIFADNDLAGREAADTLRARAARAGLQARVVTPSVAGADWCDVWAARNTVTIEPGIAA